MYKWKNIDLYEEDWVRSDTTPCIHFPTTILKRVKGCHRIQLPPLQNGLLIVRTIVTCLEWGISHFHFWKKEGKSVAILVGFKNGLWKALLWSCILTNFFLWVFRFSWNAIFSRMELKREKRTEHLIDWLINKSLLIVICASLSMLIFNLLLIHARCSCAHYSDHNQY